MSGAVLLTPIGFLFLSWCGFVILSEYPVQKGDFIVFKMGCCLCSRKRIFMNVHKVDGPAIIAKIFFTRVRVLANLCKFEIRAFVVRNRLAQHKHVLVLMMSDKTGYHDKEQ